MKVDLYGSQGHKTLDLPTPISKDTQEITAETDSRHRKAVFAALSELETRFNTAGITTADYWDMIRSEFAIVSRSELSEPMWARLSATLNACRRDTALFNKLVKRVKSHRERQQTPLTDASPVIFAEPDDTITTCFVMRRDRLDGTETLIFVGELTDKVRERCQAHADKSRCIVFLYHAGRKAEPFYPSRENGRSPF